ncbi:hypothetical protein EFN38_05565, partial [Leuconostoc mesenteroides]|nr:hypothetical protein [Leuconostoc mesenteroides]
TNKTTKKISHTRRSPKDRNYPSTPFDKLPKNDLCEAYAFTSAYSCVILIRQHRISFKEDAHVI